MANMCLFYRVSQKQLQRNPQHRSVASAEETWGLLELTAPPSQQRVLQSPAGREKP